MQRPEHVAYTVGQAQNTAAYQHFLLGSVKGVHLLVEGIVSLNVILMSLTLFDSQTNCCH